MDDLLSEFLTEANENLAELDRALLALERVAEADTVALIFRLVHTIKGTCGFLGLPRLERVSHAAENVLGLMRAGTLAPSGAVVDAILSAVDAMRQIVAALAATQAEPPGTDDAVIASLDALLTPAQPPKRPRRRAGPTRAAAEPPPVERPQAEPEPQPPAAPPAADDGARAAQPTTIRVSVEVLENLMTLVSELVLTRNQLLQIARTGGDALFDGPVQRLSQITTDLQEGVMKTRMQPIGAAWSKLPRLVRDLSHELGKPMQLRMVGEETEIDRQVLELVRDPLTHMVRNSADHGLEPPAERRQAGKPDCGTISLHAYHEGGHITLRIEDDGRGLPLDGIRAKALALGLAPEAELASMDDAAVSRFIFHPGFSTAATVTSVSGRGVGMDVVKTNIERIGGSIAVTSQPGRGTRFVIRIPLTLAIVSALIVESGGERFAIAQSSVAELVLADHVTPTRPARPGQTVIERIEATPVLRLRDRLVPLVTLSELLQLGPAAPRPSSYVVVLSLGATTLGLVVDRVFDTEEIVVKPVAPVLRDIPAFSGNTVLGDGAVIMILDANGIARTAHVQEEAAAHATLPDGTARATGSDDTTTILLFRAGSPTPKAVPLSLVARLEQVDAARIETTAGGLTVQYCGQLMPLLPIAAAFDPAGRTHHPVLVFADEGRSVGLIVDEIVDVVEGQLVAQSGGSGGVLGTAIIDGHATELVDTAHFLSLAQQDWFHQRHRRPDSRHLLVVEDSAFFRNMLIPALSSAGYRVTAVHSGDEALALLRQGQIFSAIVSDIEMPGIDGLTLARTVRGQPGWQDLPMVALSGRATPADIAAGLDAGFTHYMAKFDREALLDRLQRCLEPDLQVAA